MATYLKCKKCGGNIEVNENMRVGKCLYCGSIITLPKIDSEKKARMFNRANEYLLDNEFDKAYSAFEAVVEEDETEAEAYWGLCLSEYGVEYVEDPVTKERIPTCHRTLVKSILTSKNYEFACKYADTESRMLYQDEAERIDAIQKRILAISSKEEPYEVFICYKETDENGERTRDSVIAQEIYQELDKNGIRTFFSRITLEGKLGNEYEPYIYASLNSAKIMLVVGTSYDRINSVWVRNEWQRFLSFMNQDEGKILIPVYEKMTPYEFPEQLSRFQSQNMEKIGAVQDLVYGIKKILDSETREGSSAALRSLLAEKQERDAIKEAAEEKKKKRKEILKKSVKRAITIVVIIAAIFALYSLGKYIDKTVIQPNNTYNQAMEEFENKNYEEAEQLFESIPQFRNSLEMYDQVVGEELKNDFIMYAEQGTLGTNIDLFKDKLSSRSYYSTDEDNIYGIINEIAYETAKELAEEKDFINAGYALEYISDDEYLDTKELKYNYRYSALSEELENGDIQEAVTGLMSLYSEENNQEVTDLLYKAGEQCIQNSEYELASDVFKLISGYKESDNKYKESQYKLGLEYLEEEDYENARRYLKNANNYEDAENQYLNAVYADVCSKKDGDITDALRDDVDMLISSNYTGAEELKEEIEKWKAESTDIYVIMSMGNMQEIGFEVTLAGGPRDGKTHVRFRIDTVEGRFNYTSEDAIGEGETTSATLSNYAVTYDMTNVEYTVSFYDDNGNLIGSQTGYPEFH